jgi:hypothetical protein
VWGGASSFFVAETALFRTRYERDLRWQMLSNLAKLLIFSAVQQTCRVEHLDDVSAYLSENVLQPPTAYPNALCKRALAYSLRVTIHESDPANRERVWEPLLYKKKLMLADNLNFHSEQITLYSEPHQVLLLYPDSLLVEYPMVSEANEHMLKQMHGMCKLCKKAIVGPQAGFRLDCGHSFHHEHFMKYVEEATLGRFLLTPEEQKQSVLTCPWEECQKGAISEAVLQKLLGALYSHYDQDRQRRGAIKILKLQCCGKELAFDTFRVAFQSLYRFEGLCGR